MAQLASWSYARFQEKLKSQVGPECGKNTKRIRKVYEIFKTNYENKEYQKKFMKSPRDPLCDPLYSLSESSNGNIT